MYDCIDAYEPKLLLLHKSTRNGYMIELGELLVIRGTTVFEPISRVSTELDKKLLLINGFSLEVLKEGRISDGGTTVVDVLAMI